jgi:hypothetical protein
MTAEELAGFGRLYARGGEGAAGDVGRGNAGGLDGGRGHDDGKGSGGHGVQVVAQMNGFEAQSAHRWRAADAVVRYARCRMRQGCLSRWGGELGQLELSAIGGAGQMSRGQPGAALLLYLQSCAARPAPGGEGQ